LLLSDKTNLKLKEKNYNRLIEISINLNKHNFENNLLSYIPKDYSQVSNTDNKIKKEVNSKLVIIIDGLDEAAVADHSKRISDWFYLYNDKGERAEKWIAPGHIKWIFTYRQTSKDSKEGFQFEYHEFKTHDLAEVQPLKGLLKDAVIKGLKEEFEDFDPKLADEFIEKIIEKGTAK
jgi:hypothetical protein